MAHRKMRNSGGGGHKQASVSALSGVTKVTNIKKNALRTTSALCALMAGIGGTQAAEPIKLGIGGFVTQWVGTSTQASSFKRQSTTSAGDDRTYSRVHSVSNNEIHFLGETKLDNGLTVSVVVEVEADQGTATSLDQTFVSVAGNFGTVRLGAHDNALWAAHHAAPDVGIGLSGSDGRYGLYVVTPGNFTDVIDTGFSQDGTVRKISYLTPEFMGLVAFATYTPTPNTLAQASSFRAIDAGLAAGPAWVVGVTYDQKYGEMWKVGADLGYGRMTHGSTTNALRSVQAGLNIGYGDLTIGGGYVKHSETHWVAATSIDGHAFDIAASYAFGDASASIGWFRSKTMGATATRGNDVKDEIALSGAYVLGPGIEIKGSAFHVDYDDETTVKANSNEGWGLVGGIAIKF